MKRISFILLIIITIISCTTQLEDRIPTLQAKVNGVNLWEATDFSITTNSLGEGIISGNNFNSAITLRFPSISLNTFDFRDNMISEATYQDSIQYSTLNDGIASIAYFSDGEITINEITADSKVSGTFNFNAYDSSGNLTVNISQGIFYRIPLLISNQD